MKRSALIAQLLLLMAILAGCSEAAPSASPPLTPAPTRVAHSTADPELALDPYLATLHPPSFSGVVVVASRMSATHQWVVGTANVATAAPITVDTQFDVASLGKFFTAFAIGQLVDLGRVGFDDLASKYVPGLNPEAAQTVTIRELLSHRAGTGDFLSDPGYLQAKDHITTVRQLLAAIDLKAPLLFPAGTSWSYSNTGYAILGRVVEAASGLDYYTYVVQNILKPYGMLHTGFFEKTALPSTAAIGYLPNGGTNLSVLGLKGTPAGGVYTTAADLLAFDHAMVYGGIVATATSRALSEALAPPPPPGGSPRPIRAIPEGLFAGGEPGANAVLGLFNQRLGTPVTVVVLANGSPPMAEDVASQVVTFLDVGF